MLEQLMHASSSFVTLTYSANDGYGPGDLVPEDMQLWLKRFRKEVPPRSVRYFGVGEYSPAYRPHFHLAMFGVGWEHHELVANTWGLGRTSVDELNEKTAAYICGYITNKGGNYDAEPLRGKHPEFARMSLRPAIGKGAISHLANVIAQSPGRTAWRTLGEVPTSIVVQGKRRPLGRYVRSQLRLHLGVDHREPGFIRDGRNFARALEAEEKYGRAGAWRAVDDREQKRIQVNRNAKARESIQRSKRGIA